MQQSASYIDKRSIMQVLGNIKNNPNILTRTDKYELMEEDFGEEFHVLLFGVLQNLKAQGLQKISLLDIDNYLSGRPGAKKLYEENRGAEYLTEVSKIADPNKFDYYYERMKKMTLLRMYMEYGVDIRWLYNPDTLDVQLKQEQEDWLDSVDREEIVSKVDRKLDEIRSKYSYEGNEQVQAGKNIFELIEDLKTSPEVGPPMFGPLINTVTRGARLKKFYLRSAPTGVGKAIPDYTPIPTPQGYKTVGEIKAGDKIFGYDGKPTTVLQIHPQQEKKEIWEIEFADGRVAESCGDHLWEYRYRGRRGYNYRVETTEEMFERISKLKNGLKNSDGRGYRFHIRMNEAVEYEEKEFPISPYVMGLMLGDGSFRTRDDQKAFVFSTRDKELAEAVASDLNAVKKKNIADNYSYTFEKKMVGPKRKNLWVEEVLKDYPDLINAHSYEKYIPEDYLLGSIKQRKELLSGLLDTDGSIDKEGRVTFHSNSLQLIKDVVELVRSLGYVATVTEDKRAEKHTNGEMFRVNIQLSNEEKPEIFKLKRKLDIAVAAANSKKRQKKKDHNAIVDIRKTKKKTDMTCFTVDNDKSLFLMNDFIVTHNTRMMIADACNLACNQIYDIYSQEWLPNGESQPTLYITTEQELDEIQTMMLAFVSGVDEDHIIDGRYLAGEEERVLKAAEIISESPLWIEEMPDFSLDDVENTIRSHILDNDVTMVFFDYIHTSLKIMEEITRKTGGVRLREDQILYMLAIRLKDIANQLGVFVLSSTQLNASWEESENGNQNLLRGSKAIADKVDFGAVVLPVTEDDLKKLSPLLTSGAIPEPNLVYHVYKNRRSRHTSVKMWCSANLGICRVTPVVLTDNQYKVIPLEDFNITVDDEFEVR